MWRCTGPLAVIGQLFEAIIENGKNYDYRLLYERGVSVTKDDFVRALAAEGITMDDHRMSYHIRMAELSGTLCSGNLHPQKATYSLVRTKIGQESVLPDRDECLAMLARKYFRSHSPATLEDFVWWSGLGVADCRRATELLGCELHSEIISGREFFIHADCRTRGFRKGGLILLPSYDEFLIGYKSRDVVLDYSLGRLDRCKFGNAKTKCHKCPVHCYRPDMRERIRAVMRFSGPRMILHHPLEAIRYLVSR